jgi:hypothetical protein
MLMSRWTPYALLLATLVISGSASQAAPVTYFFDEGTAHIVAVRSSNLSVVVDDVIDLGGAFVTFDADTSELTDFEINVAPTDPIMMDQVYGGFDTFVIESAALTPGVGYSSVLDVMLSPTRHALLVGPVDVVGVYSAFSSTGPPPPPVSNLPVPFTNPTGIGAIIDTEMLTLEINGITLLHLDGGVLGEPDDLIVFADIQWFGVVPEPTTATLVGLGLGLVGVARRRARVP